MSYHTIEYRTKSKQTIPYHNILYQMLNTKYIIYKHEFEAFSEVCHCLLSLVSWLMVFQLPPYFFQFTSFWKVSIIDDISHINQWKIDFKVGVPLTHLSKYIPPPHHIPAYAMCSLVWLSVYYHYLYSRTLLTSHPPGWQGAVYTISF